MNETSVAHARIRRTLVGTAGAACFVLAHVVVVATAPTTADAVRSVTPVALRGTIATSSTLTHMTTTPHAPTHHDKVTAATTTTAVTQPPAVGSGPDTPSASLLRAQVVVRNMHYTPVANAWYPDSVPGPLLEAIEAVPTGTVIGNQGHKVFFFVSGRYVGTDTNDGSANLEFAYSTGLVVAVNYDLYHPSDPLCCPSAGAKTVRFQWEGSQLHVLDSVPSPDPTVDPTRN